MDCPVCREAMVTCELNEVEVDYCPSCTGIWLDEGELEILLGNSDNAHKLLHSFKKVSDHSEILRKCPICLKKMNKIIVSDSQNPLILDKCAKDHGLWFDKGELQEIVKRADLDCENKIQNALADMFNI